MVCRRRSSPGLVAAIAVVGLSACATGQRPSLVDQPQVRDELAATVLDRLDRAGATTFTALYTITAPQVGSQPVQATVIQSGLRQHITIGDTDYYVDASVSRTCTAGGAECTDGLNDGPISNLGITHAFWGESSAAKLRIDAARSIAPTTGSTDTIASWPAACVEVEVPAVTGVGTLTYCALDAGVLARYLGPNVTIELNSYAPTADENRLTTP